MTHPAFRLAASTIMIAVTMVASTAPSAAMRRGPDADQAQNYRAAAAFHEAAAKAYRAGNMSSAIRNVEEAVSRSPRDVGYRLFLADLYLKNGRFASARSTYSDVTTLDPTNLRGSMSLALMEIAAGRPQAAVAQLDELQGRASAADLGLAYALAGLPERAIEILEPAARSTSSGPRLRQNLALAYAFAGDWRKARAIAAQDVSAAELGERMEQWAAMARPDVPGSSQIAHLMGVSPVEDPGQPIRLALNAPTSAPAIAFAEAEPEARIVAASSKAETATFAAAQAPSQDSDWGLPPAASQTPVAPPVQVAAVVSSAPAASTIAAASYYLPPAPAPAPTVVTQVRAFASAEAQVEAPASASAQAEAEEAPMRAAAASLVRPQPVLVPKAQAALPRGSSFHRATASRQPGRGASPFVVQLGAFSNEANAERAWVNAQHRFGLGDHVPLTTTFQVSGRALHRVSVSGFASQSEAARLCASIRGKGGACFVRANAGDASVRWAARYAADRNRRV